ncbi:MAG: hypothetical protein J7J28_05120 [Thaumarchaeota archaeon]|nr:hypothetical protein [Nitrososphaerota archaeon]
MRSSIVEIAAPIREIGEMDGVPKNVVEIMMEFMRWNPKKIIRRMLQTTRLALMIAYISDKAAMELRDR